ncbi:LacI family DNA-binding transcriptional regulator [Leifsonia sp. NPDC058230]|uniref:LacI family DNA-binding transcriptional regulator n=1 Tax=Leifsonia sp. NPDC058230 TaxID=3346391 RepID=UPI0036D99360
MPAKRSSRPTIADVAARAGVSKMAVSFALNGRPGVSEETRARVERAAADLGWRPNSAARSLSGDRAGAIGLVLARSAQQLAMDTFYMQLITGIEQHLAESSTSLLLQVPSSPDHELSLYRTLAAERRVDAVVVTDLLTDDPRIPLLRELGLPAVLLGGPEPGFVSLRSDDEGSVAQVVEHLHGLGHRRIGRITGPVEFRYTVKRSEAFAAALARSGMSGMLETTDGSPEAGRAATERMLRSPEPPTALVFDTDLLAVAGLDAVRDIGLRVPEDVSLVAWDGSILCDVVRPRLTSLRRDVVELGRVTARAVLDVGSAPRTGDEGFVFDEHDPSSPQLEQRESSGRAPH